MKGVGGKDGWSWIFIIEGLLTFVVRKLMRLIHLVSKKSANGYAIRFRWERLAT